MKISTKAAALMILGLTACKEEDVVLGDRVIHENGLSVNVPLGFEMTEAQDGFVFRQAGQLRTAMVVTLRKLEHEPTSTGAASRELGGADVKFEILDHGSYSGGTEHELVAWKATPPVWIKLNATQQIEGSAPNFALAWSVFEKSVVIRSPTVTLTP